MSQHEEEGELTPDEMVAILTGKCVHEVQFDRVMGLLGVVVATHGVGGKLELDLKALDKMAGRGISLVVDEAKGIATVELTDVPPTDLPMPTHSPSTVRH